MQHIEFMITKLRNALVGLQSSQGGSSNSAALKALARETREAEREAERRRIKKLRD